MESKAQAKWAILPGLGVGSPNSATCHGLKNAVFVTPRTDDSQLFPAK
jgi:hypothetical protein